MPGKLLVFLGWAGLLTSLSLAGTGFGSTEEVEGGIGQLTADGAWCWFADPRAIYYSGRHRALYAGWVNAEGFVQIASYHEDDGRLTTSTLRHLQRDDHANPALLVRPDGRIMVFYSAHNGATMYYRESRNPEDISAWREERTMASNVAGRRGYTYPNPLQLRDENNRIYLFWRGGTWLPTFSTSEDGLNWSPARVLIEVPGQRPYIKFAGNGIDSIHFAFTDGHPRNVANNIYYARYRKGALYRADGTKIAGLEELPLVPQQADKVYDASRAGKAWIWDIALDQQERAVIVYATFPDDADHRYRYARWSGSGWTDHEITPAGRPIDGPREPHYSGGIVLNHADPSIVYLSREIDGIHEVEKWRTPDEGKTWISQPITTRSRQKNVRPVVPRGHRSGEVEVLWMQGEYPFYTEYQTALKLYPQPAALKAWSQAEANARQAQKALQFCWRYSQGWLQFIDPVTGLLPRNLKSDYYWNAKDSAADNYPFLVLTSFFTDESLFRGRMLDILKTEQRLCNRIGHLPDDWDFQRQSFRTPEPNLDDLIFGASEYIKDGLLPLTEWLGASPWSERLIQLLDDILGHARIRTEVGPLASTSHEVAGEMMQALSRMYWMTGNQRYKETVYRLASYFLDHHLPTQEPHLRLDDHGCEVIGGLSEAYFIAAQENSELHARWRAPMHAMLDRILEVGRDAQGLLFSVVNPVSGEILNEDRTDNWGYNYMAFGLVAELDGVERYHEALRHVLTNLPHSKDYPWEGDRADGIADSLEGALTLLNRYPILQAADWAEHMAERLFAKQRDTGIIEGWHGDGNAARTALMYALWKSQGAYVSPWRSDVRTGAFAAPDGSFHFVVQADWPWQGTLHFDIPRHREYLKLPRDYPRLNQFPEWFTVNEQDEYECNSAVVSGRMLREGLSVRVTPEQPFHLKLTRRRSTQEPGP